MIAKTEQDKLSMEDPTYQYDLEQARHRLDLFAEISGTVAPTRMLDDEEVPTTEFLQFCVEAGCSLNWIFMGQLPARLTPIRA